MRIGLDRQIGNGLGFSHGVFIPVAADIEVLGRGLVGLLHEPVQDHDGPADQGAVEGAGDAFRGLGADLEQALAQRAGGGIPRSGSCSGIRTTKAR